MQPIFRRLSCRQKFVTNDDLLHWTRQTQQTYRKSGALGFADTDGCLSETNTFLVTGQLNL